MTFLKNIQDSIYSPAAYSTLPKKSFKRSVGYFLLLILLLTIIKVITLINPLLIEAPIALQGFTQDVIDCYPKELEVKVTNGQVSTNTSQPYFIPACKGLNQSQNLAVIDTQTPYSSSQFDKYQTQVWVTKDAVVFKKNNYETNSYNLTKVKDFKLDRQLLNSYQKTISPYLKFIGPILLLLSFTGIFLSYNFRLIYLLLLSSIIWLLGKVFKQTLAYGQAYKVGLHAITLGLIVELFVSLTARWTHFTGFPFMVSIYTLGVVLLNLILPKKGQDS